PGHHVAPTIAPPCSCRRQPESRFASQSASGLLVSWAWSYLGPENVGTSIGTVRQRRSFALCTETDHLCLPLWIEPSAYLGLIYPRARGKEWAMRACQLIDGASFGPDTLKAIGQAFDQAWAEIAGNFDDTQVENARLRLAEAMLSIATGGSIDVAALKAGALQAMALDYRSGIRPVAKNPNG